MNEKLWEVVPGKDSKTILRSLPIRIKTKKTSSYKNKLYATSVLILSMLFKNL